MSLLRRKRPSNAERVLRAVRATARGNGGMARGAAIGAATLVGLTTASALVSSAREREKQQDGEGAGQSEHQ